MMDPLVAKYGEDVDELFDSADVVVDEQLRMHRHGAVPLEPRAPARRVRRAAGRLTVWGAAKVKHFNRRALGGMLGLAETRFAWSSATWAARSGPVASSIPRTS